MGRNQVAAKRQYMAALLCLWWASCVVTMYFSAAVKIMCIHSLVQWCFVQLLEKISVSVCNLSCTAYPLSRFVITKFSSLIFFMIRSGPLVKAVESYRLWLEGPGFESRSPRIAQTMVRLATNTLPQTSHRAGALCTGYALFIVPSHSFNAMTRSSSMFYSICCSIGGVLHFL